MYFTPHLLTLKTKILLGKHHIVDTDCPEPEMTQKTEQICCAEMTLTSPDRTAGIV